MQQRPPLAVLPGGHDGVGPLAKQVPPVVPPVDVTFPVVVPVVVPPVDVTFPVVVPVVVPPVVVTFPVVVPVVVPPVVDGAVFAPTSKLHCADLPSARI